MFRRDFLKAVIAAPPGIWAARAASGTTLGDGVATAARQTPSLRVGVARIDITPAVPVCLEGYLDPGNRISTGIHDRIYARAFAFSVGASRLVLVSCDLASMTFGDYLRKPIADTLGLGLEELLLCAIHTHSGPLLTLHPSYPDNVAYTKHLPRLLTRVVDRALRARRPARLAFGTARSRVGVSRRLIMPDGRVEMMPNPTGIADPEVAVVQATRNDGTAIGALFAYACHSRSLRGTNRLLSGDVLGIAAQDVEQAAPGCIVGALAGASGDVDPIRVVDGFDADGNGPPVDMGLDLGRSVHDALEDARPLRVERLHTRHARVALPPKHPGQARWVCVEAVALGDLAIVGLDCEASTEIGLAIKASSPFRSTLVVTNCNGWSGYLPVARQYAEGGYEVDRSGFGRDASGQLVTEVTGILRRL